MSDLALRVDSLSKKYRIGGPVVGYNTLRERISAIATAPASWFKKKDPEANTFWALKDVSFEVKQGDVIGIIGRNGAGKSTLLKVLSRITSPTEGGADIHGRIGSLLEVGTGFHPELTGRENIYLNGAILGMKRTEIDREFDNIVAFSEVAKFIDTPIKRYSSGMYLRLAFAVAAHLQTEILLVDEVLAVGDIAFQKKCIGKMGEVAKQGRTVLFVSHNMGAVRSLCKKGVVLNDGKVVMHSDIGPAIEKYYRLAAERESNDQNQAPVGGTGFGPVSLAGKEGSTIQQNEAFEVETTLHIKKQVAGFSLILKLEDANQRPVFHLRRDSPELLPDEKWVGRYKIKLKIPPLWLEPNVYSLFFKVLFWRNEAGMARSVSDVFHLDVGGNACGWGSILSPGVEWKIAAPKPGIEDSTSEITLDRVG